MRAGGELLNSYINCIVKFIKLCNRYLLRINCSTEYLTVTKLAVLVRAPSPDCSVRLQSICRVRAGYYLRICDVTQERVRGVGKQTGTYELLVIRAYLNSEGADCLSVIL